MKRVLIDLAYRIRRYAMRVANWRTTGVRTMVFDESGALLLLRHRYGNRELWMMPGGGVDRGEEVSAAAAREVREETGCRVHGLVGLGVFRNASEGRRDTVHLFRGVTGDTPVADGIEIAEARFFPLDSLPATTSPATMRRIAEMIGQRTVSEEW